jgi:hypothetical protein
MRRPGFLNMSGIIIGISISTGIVSSATSGISRAPDLDKGRVLVRRR